MQRDSCDSDRCHLNEEHMRDVSTFVLTSRVSVQDFTAVCDTRPIPV